MAGLEPGELSVHGLRSGYLTQAANRREPLPEAMEQSRHRSVQLASSYCNSAARRSGWQRDFFEDHSDLNGYTSFVQRETAMEISGRHHRRRD